MTAARDGGESRERSAAQLAALCSGDVVGDAGRIVSDVAPLGEAGPRHLSFLSNPKYRAAARSSGAGVLVVSRKDAGELPGRTLVVAKDAYAAFATFLTIFRPAPPLPAGIHGTAVVGEGAVLGEGCALGARAVVGAGAKLGERVVVCAGAIVGDGCEVGDDSLLHPNVVLYPGSAVGRRCVLHAGVVIGADGYGFATVSGVHRKIPQVGRAIVEDDVEIGANSTVDRGALGDTVVGAGTKIDNLVMVAHGVKLGRGCLLVAQSGIAGSTKLGDFVTFAGQSGAVGHVTIGNRAIVGAKSAVTHDVPEGAFVTGHPAAPHRDWLKRQAALGRLPELLERVRRLESALAASGGKSTEES